MSAFETIFIARYSSTWSTLQMHKKNIIPWFSKADNTCNIHALLFWGKYMLNMFSYSLQLFWISDKYYALYEYIMYSKIICQENMYDHDDEKLYQSISGNIMNRYTAHIYMYLSTYQQWYPCYQKEANNTLPSWYFQNATFSSLTSLKII